MIIPESVRQAYDTALPIWENLKGEVDAKFGELIVRYPSVTYKSRIKQVESVMLKLEKGEYSQPFWQMEDFFACTLTVPLLTMLEVLGSAVAEVFIVHPPRIQKKTPDPEAFPYADLHLNLSLKDEPLRKDKSVLNLVFELQIKTLLQEAWSKAGHPIIYKPRRLSWGVARVASEIRALLEMADNVLANIEKVASIRGEVSYSKFETINQIIVLIEDKWSSIELAEDRRRAATIISDYLAFCGATPEDLAQWLNHDQYKQYLSLKSLTPTQVVFIILFLEKLRGKLSKFKPQGRKFLITREMLDACQELSEIPTTSYISMSAAVPESTSSM